MHTAAGRALSNAIEDDRMATTWLPDASEIDQLSAAFGRRLEGLPVAQAVTVALSIGMRAGRALAYAELRGELSHRGSVRRGGLLRHAK